MSVERIGIAETEKTINQMGFIFREQPTDDCGIDAQIETVEDGKATGKLIAVQIKSGKSYFSEKAKDGFVFRGERKHYDYWLNHYLPVMIVLYNPDEDKCYWNVVNKSTATLTSKQWKINIPYSNELKDAKRQIVELADNLTDYEKKYNAFLFAKPWMKEVLDGNKIVLNVEEWINKSSGKGTFKLRIIDRDGNEKQVFYRSMLGFGTKPYYQVLKELFPWATIKIDSDYYQEYDEIAIIESDFEAALYAYYEFVGATFDLDTMDYCIPEDAPSLESWMKDEENLRPYRIAAGEVAFYQLVLDLNLVAKSFLIVDDFINCTSFYSLME